MIEASKTSKVYMMCNDGNPFMVIKGDANSFGISNAQSVSGEIGIQLMDVADCKVVNFFAKLRYTLNGEGGEISMNNILIPGEKKSDETLFSLSKSDRLYIVFGNDETEEIALRSIPLETELKAGLTSLLDRVKGNAEIKDYEKIRREAILRLA